jgi:hypothetical protein
MAKHTEHALRLRLHSINMKAAGFTVKNPNQGGGNMNITGMLAGDQGNEFFNGAMGLRQGHGHQGKIKRGSSGLGQGGGGGSYMV